MNSIGNGVGGRVELQEMTNIGGGCGVNSLSPPAAAFKNKRLISIDETHGVNFVNIESSLTSLRGGAAEDN
jgi:hypothetical protein